MQQQLKSLEVLALEEKVIFLEKKLTSETKRLREAIEAWRCKVEGKGTKRESLREGYNAERGMHYKVYVLDLPGDLSINQVLDIIKEDIMPQIYPYTFKRVDYSRKYDGWLLEIERELNKDMSLEAAFLSNYYSHLNNLE